MHIISVSIKNGDRVITAARLNSGAESLAGLGYEQIQALAAGEAVFVDSSNPMMQLAVVKLDTESGSWEYEGMYDELPDLDASSDPAAVQYALSEWAKYVRCLALF